jgi:hypothetical protein
VPAPLTTAPDIDARVALIQALIPVALDKVLEELQADVERLAGARYAREGRLPGHVRWTRQRGSVYLGAAWLNFTGRQPQRSSARSCHRRLRERTSFPERHQCPVARLGHLLLACCGMRS